MRKDGGGGVKNKEGDISRKEKRSGEGGKNGEEMAGKMMLNSLKQGVPTSKSKKRRLNI